MGSKKNQIGSMNYSETTKIINDKIQEDIKKMVHPAVRIETVKMNMLPRLLFLFLYLPALCKLFRI